MTGVQTCALPIFKNDILLVFKLILGTSCLGIFRPLSAADWVLAGKLLEANRAYTAWDSVYKAIGA